MNNIMLIPYAYRIGISKINYRKLVKLLCCCVDSLTTSLNRGFQFNPLSAKFIKLSVFDHFSGLAFKGLTITLVILPSCRFC